MNGMWLSDEERHELTSLRVDKRKRDKRRERVTYVTGVLFAAMGAIIVVASLWGMAK